MRENVWSEMRTSGLWIERWGWKDGNKVELRDDYQVTTADGFIVSPDIFTSYADAKKFCERIESRFPDHHWNKAPNDRALLAFAAAEAYDWARS